MSPELLLLALTSTATAAGGAGPVEYTLDAASTLSFVAKQTFSDTEGYFKKVTGRFEIDKARPADSSVYVRIEAASIDTGNSDRDDHLRNPDFFEVAKHPHIEFRSTTVEAKGADKVRVKGKLRVKGKDTPVAFDLALDWHKQGRLRAKGALKVSRSKLGLTYEAPFYIPSIKDEVEIRLDVLLKPAK